MVNLGELEKTIFDGQVQLRFTRYLAALKEDARELEVLREEIRVVIARTARYLSRPMSVRPKDLETVMVTVSDASRATHTNPS
jgi:hypothetical protein